MKFLKYLVPVSYLAKTKKTGSLVASILLYAAIIILYFLFAAQLGFRYGTLTAWLLGLLGTVVGLYCTVGMVISVLRYSGVTK